MIDFSEINSQLNNLNNMEINTNKNTQQIGKSLEEMKTEILSEIESFVKEIIGKKENERTDEYKREVLTKISKITKDISELIKRINRFNELVDREKSDKRLRDFHNKKNRELKGLIEKNQLPEELQEKIQELSKSSNMTESQYNTIIQKLESEKIDITQLQQSVIRINQNIDEIKNQLTSELDKNAKSIIDKLQELATKKDIERLERKIDKLKPLIKGLDKLQSSFDTFQTNINTDIDSTNNQLGKLNESIAELNKRIPLLNNLINTLNDNVGQLGDKTDELNSKFSDMSGKIDELNSLLTGTLNEENIQFIQENIGGLIDAINQVKMAVETSNTKTTTQTPSVDNDEILKELLKNKDRIPNTKKEKFIPLEEKIKLNVKNISSTKEYDVNDNQDQLEQDQLELNKIYTMIIDGYGYKSEDENKKLFVSIPFKETKYQFDVDKNDFPTNFSKKFKIIEEVKFNNSNIVTPGIEKKRFVNPKQPKEISFKTPNQIKERIQELEENEEYKKKTDRIKSEINLRKQINPKTQKPYNAIELKENVIPQAIKAFESTMKEKETEQKKDKLVKKIGKIEIKEFQNVLNKIGTPPPPPPPPGAPPTEQTVSTSDKQRQLLENIVNIESLINDNNLKVTIGNQNALVELKANLDNIKSETNIDSQIIYLEQAMNKINKLTSDYDSTKQNLTNEEKKRMDKLLELKKLNEILKAQSDSLNKLVSEKREVSQIKGEKISTTLKDESQFTEIEKLKEKKTYTNTELKNITIFLEKIKLLLDDSGQNYKMQEEKTISVVVKNIIDNFNKNKSDKIIQIVQPYVTSSEKVSTEYPIIAIHSNFNPDNIIKFSDKYDFLFHLNFDDNNIKQGDYVQDYNTNNNIWLIGIYKYDIINLKEIINLKANDKNNIKELSDVTGNIDESIYGFKDGDEYKNYFKSYKDEIPSNIITENDIKPKMIIEKSRGYGGGYYNYNEDFYNSFNNQQLYGGQYARQYYYPRQIKQPLHNFIVPLMVFKMYRIILYKKLLKNEQKFVFQNIFIDIVSSFMLIIGLFTLGLKKVASVLFTDLLSSVVVIYLFLFAYDDYVKDKSKVNVQCIINVLILIPYFVMYL